jgi:hypothetical protein
VSSLADNLARRGDWNEAIVLAGKHGDDNGKFQAWLGLARVAGEQRAAERVDDMLERAAGLLEPGNVSQATEFAVASLQLERRKPAERALTNAPLRGDVSGFSLGYRARALAMLDQVEEADALAARLTESGDRSFAASALIEASVRRKEWKRAKSYLHDLNPSTFDPTSVGYAYAKVVWGLLEQGKDKDAKALMQEIAKLPAAGSTTHADAMYMVLTDLAAKARAYDRAGDFLQQTDRDGWRANAVSAIAQAKIEDKDYPAAITLLAEHLGMKYYAANVPLFDLWLRAVDALEQEGRHEEALRVLMQAAEGAVTRRDADALEKFATRFEQFGDAEGARRLQASIRDLKWIVVAKRLEQARTADPEAAYADIQKKDGKDIPREMAGLAREYLQELQRLRTMQ